MIKLFRNIRKNLIVEGKTARYFKYAIGEIVLVVIGILIALQLNTWNQNRLTKNEEYILLKSLKIEFENNLKSFDSMYVYQLARDSVINRLIKANHINERLTSLDSLLDKVNWNYTFNPSKGVYNSIIYSGKIELISNTTLKTEIAQFDDQLVDYLEEELIAFEYHRNQFEPYLMDGIPRRYPLGSRAAEDYKNDSIAYFKLVENFPFKNRIIVLKDYLSSIFEEGPGVRKKYISIIELLESEINRLEK